MKYLINKQNLIAAVKCYSVNAAVYYPVKANNSRDVIKILDPYVAGYEVASMDHLKQLICKLKINPERILYSAPIKTNAEIKKALLLNVNNFVIDNIDELKRVIYLAGSMSLNILLRIDVLNFIKTGQLVLKWGASIKDIIYMKNLIAESVHNYMGLSFYIPQEVESMGNFLAVINGLMHEIGLDDCKTLDIGGGIPSDVVDELLSTVRNMCGFREINFIVEPGRYLLNPNIDMVVKVTDIREKQGLTLIFIDSGIYGGLLDKAIKNRKFRISSMNECNEQFCEEKMKCLICGDTSDISDVIGIYELSKSINVGDKLIISECGAYCSTLDTSFCKNKRVNRYCIVDP